MPKPIIRSRASIKYIGYVPFPNDKSISNDGDNNVKI